MESASENSRSPSLNSYDTALCIIPPTALTHDVNRLRALYDKAYEKWPPHINLIYPFAAPESLPRAVDAVRSALAEKNTGEFAVRLDKADFFAHKRTSTVYITDGGDGCKALQRLREQILSAFENAEAPFQPHLTIGQCEANDDSTRDYLVSKTSLLPPVEWSISELAVLIRDRSAVPSTTMGQMRVYGTIKLSGEYAIKISDMAPLSNGSPASVEAVRKNVTYGFVSAADETAKGVWKALDFSATSDSAKLTKTSISVASYNVLIGSMQPPPTERYPILVKNMLDDSSSADILVLQEVSDDFLSYLLKNDQICARYPFSSHGPPEQPEIGPLPSLRNIVVLSRWRFRWEWLPFEKRHKGSVVLQLEDIGSFRENQFLPLVVTGVHLTSGLIDTSIAAKYSQVKAIIGHLKANYQDHHWIVAGDFNITTSSYTIDAALKRNVITAHGASILSSLEVFFSDSGLLDCYFANRVTGSTTSQRREEFAMLYEGEEGATYDPTENALAAGFTGRSYHSRPQRYDRIFVKGEAFKVTSFNLFGLPKVNAAECLGSDHWGVRAMMDFDASAGTETTVERSSIFNVERAPRSLSTGAQLKALLDEHGMFPSEDEHVQRQTIFDLIKRMVMQKETNTTVETRLNISFVVVLVGSYRLGVWDASSDIDCLVIGNISPATFFALITRRLRRPEWNEIHTLRKVKAASGTMLEIEAGGVRLDLQYCAATAVAESWPKALEVPSTDATFDLPMQSLLKLNSIRDLDYLQRTIPDIAAFRLAYRFIKTWAKNRGVYSAKLGYLGGIHITLLLARVCKLAFRGAGGMSASDIICTFFKHYANFDWKKDMVYDPTYYSDKPRYHRSSREPLVILSIHPPKVNVARSATVPSVITLDQEFKRANRLLSKPGVKWVDFASTESRKTGASEFLKAYSSYVKIDYQFWGGATAKGLMLIGWLEFRCVSLLVDINRKFPDLHARIWPARFTTTDTNHIEGQTEHQGSFLIGLAKGSTEAVASMDESDRRSAHISLVSLLNNFAGQIRSDEDYFDSSSSWVDVSLVKQSELGCLHVDESTWDNVMIFQDDDSDDDDFPNDATENNAEDYTEPLGRSSPSIRPANSTGGANVASGAKLRPADEVLSRLRWDPAFNSADYLVGYVDRFVGAKEVPMDRWKSEQTHEEFIPMHRVLYFKRRSDGERVWDREKRIDLIFNSGASGGNV